MYLRYEQQKIMKRDHLQIILQLMKDHRQDHLYILKTEVG